MLLFLFFTTTNALRVAPLRQKPKTVNTKITGGTFSGNNADFGGFLYNKGGGIVSCTGGLVEGNHAVDGGGVYVVENATLDWACDLTGNTALTGPGM